MAICFIKLAALFYVFNYVEAQYGYYTPFQVTDMGNFQTSLLRPSFLQQAFRRTDSCSQYPGTTCTFLLSCMINGGRPAGPCPSSLLSTCCMPSTNSIVPQTLKPSSSSSNPPVKFNTITQVPDFRDKNYLATTTLRPERIKPNNLTYCGIIQAKPQSRIIGGNDAMYGEFPWQAHIKLKRQQCGGVLLNKYYVLTAAHCIYQVRLRDIVIQLGAYDIQDQSRQQNAPQTFTVLEKKVHPSFQYQAAHPDRYDVALLKLDRPARYQDNIIPICLPKKDASFLGKKGLITGWGKTDMGLNNKYGTRLLQKVDVPIITNKECEEWHEEKGIDIKISPEMLCAGYEAGQKDACVGDSGGPLIVPVQGRWVVVGLISAGFGCAQSKQPGIYHRVAHTVDWLRESITS